MCTHKLEVERTPIAVMCPRAKKKRFYEAIGRNQAMQASCNQAQKKEAWKISKSQSGLEIVFKISQANF